MQFSLIALSFPDRWNLSKLHHSRHFLELKPIHANWASAGLWLVYLDGREKNPEASCQLLFAQAARLLMKGLLPNSSSASSEIIIWDEKRDYLALQPALPYLPITTAALPALGRAALDSRGQPPYEENKKRRRDSSWSQKKGFRRWYLCLCRAV